MCQKLNYLTTDKQIEPCPFSDSDKIYHGQIESRLEDRQGMVQEILETLSAVGCQVDPYLDRFFLDETILNAIVHGNKKDPNKKVTVRVFVKQDLVGFEITDQGNGFDWESIKNKLEDPIDMTKDNGLGLTLIYAAGGKVFFHNGGRSVTIIRGSW